MREIDHDGAVDEEGRDEGVVRLRVVEDVDGQTKQETIFLDGVLGQNLHMIRAANHSSSIDWSER